MAILIAPNDRLLYRVLPDKNKKLRQNPGKWHFLKEGKDQSTVCGMVLPSYLGIQSSTVLDVNNSDICKGCWPYESNNLNQEELF